MRSKKIVFGILLALTSGCAGSLYHPTEKDVTPAATLAELRDGRRLYVNHCASCHALKQPAAFDAVTWEKEINEMGRRAELDSSSRRLILQYLVHAPGQP